MTLLPVSERQEAELQALTEDFEERADRIIDKAFAAVGARKDSLSMEEKRLVIKEFALAAKEKEVLGKLNEYRHSRELPVLHEHFDVGYYNRTYRLLVEDVALLYAENLSKKFRFANRLVRIAKISDLLEHMTARIEARKGQAEELKLDRHEERAHNDNIKLATLLFDELDEQMGKLKLTKIDINVRKDEDRPAPTSPEDIKNLVVEAIKGRFAHQIPSAVDANFSEVTDYQKCAWSENWSNMHYCRYHGDQCKVEKQEISLCPFFLNGVCVNSKEWLEKGYVSTHLTVKEMAEMAGCKEVSQKVIDYVRGKIRENGVERPS
jgi:hypothetical protein